MASILVSSGLWIGMSILFFLLFVGMSIFYIILFKKTHVMTELKAVFSKTPVAIFFQDNKFTEWKPITIANGIVYDKNYGPFIVSSTYVDKKTKNIFIPFDIDLDGDRTVNMKELSHKYKDVTNNQKSIAELRTMISNDKFDANNKNITNLVSEIKFGNMKRLFLSCTPHNIKSKIEKIVGEKLSSAGDVKPMQAVIVFGAIFGIIVIAAILLKTMGGA